MMNKKDFSYFFNKPVETDFHLSALIKMLHQMQSLQVLKKCPIAGLNK